MSSAPTDFTGNDRYEARRLIGSGASGLVYEGLDRKRGTLVALKTLRVPDPQQIYRLKQEFRTLADLHHPNLVSLYELVGADQSWFIAMELIRGLSFEQWVRGDAGRAFETLRSDELHQPFSDAPTEEVPRPTLAPDRDRLRNAARQLFAGLAALHDAGKLHLDLKPGNVLVTDEGRVVLVDFGLSYDLDRAPSELSKIDSLAGTAAFLAPEQISGRTPGPEADLYAVGCILYLSLIGRLPFEGTLPEILQAKLHHQAPRPSHWVPEVPRDLDDLIASLLDRDPARRPTARGALQQMMGLDSPASDTHPRPLEPLDHLEGREAERRALADAFATAKRGRAVLVRLSGASGIGKTLLVKHFLRGLRRGDEAMVVAGRCYERESVPYNAFDAWIDALKRRLKGLPPGALAEVIPKDIGAFAALFPVLRELVPSDDAPEPLAAPRQSSPPSDRPATPRSTSTLGQRTPSNPGMRAPPSDWAAKATHPGVKVASWRDADPVTRRLAGFDAAVALVANLSRSQPVVLFLDDVQWGDADSARLLVHLLLGLQRRAVLVILAHRSDESDSEFLQILDNDIRLARLEPRHLEVGDLSGDAALRAARALLAHAPVDVEKIAPFLARECRGNPFLLAEMANEVRAAADRGKPEEGLVRLEDLLQARVAALPEAEGDLLLAVTLAGRPLPLSVLARAAGTVDPVSVLTALRARRFVRTTRTALGELVELYHNLVGKVLRERVPERLQAACHLRLATALEQSHDRDPEQLLIHSLAGGQVHRAGAHARDAARAAEDNLAFDKAARLWRTALSLDDRGKDGVLARVALARSLTHAGRGKEAAEVWLDLAARRDAIVREFGQDGLPPRDEMERRAAEQLFLTGQLDQGFQRLRQVLQRAALPLPSGPWACLAEVAARRLWRRFRGYPFVARKEAAVDERLLARLDLAHFCALCFTMVDPMLAVVYHERALALALEAGEPSRVARALAMEVFRLGDEGDTEGRLERRARELAQDSGKTYPTGLLSLTLGMSAYLQGRFKTAHRQLRQAERSLWAEPQGAPFEVGLARVFALRALLYTGEIKAAHEQLQEALSDTEDRGNLLMATILRSDLSAIIRLAHGDVAGLRADLQSVPDRWQRPGRELPSSLRARAEATLALYEGRPADALRIIDETRAALVGPFRERPMFNRLAIADLEGRAALTLSATQPKALARVRQAANVLAGSSLRHAIALSRILEAGLAMATNRPAVAEGHLREAVQAFDRADMALHANVARRRLGALIGGPEGKTLVSAADGWMHHQGVTAVVELVELLAPRLGPTAAMVKR